MRHRIYSRIRHIPSGAWTDILFTGRTREDGVIPIHPQNVVDSHLAAAATIFGRPLSEFEVVEMLDADPAGVIRYEEDGTQTRPLGGQTIAMPQPPRATPPPTVRESLLAKLKSGQTLTQEETMAALKEVL